MMGEFYFFCENEKCGAKVTASSFPPCPKCGLQAMLCPNCMDGHDCKAAGEEEARRASDPD